MKKISMRRCVFCAPLVAVLAVLSVSRVEAKGQSAKPAPLVLYTNAAPDSRYDFILEKSKAAGFDIKIMNMGSGDITNRAIAEKNNPVADIIYGVNSVDMEKLVNAGLMHKFEPAWKNKIDQTLIVSSGLYYPIGVVPLVMVYNKNVYTSSTAPKDWTDLAANPAYKGKYNLLSLGGGTARMIIVSILMRYTDPNGVYGISAQGWDIMRQFIQGGHPQQEGDDWFGEIMRGEYPIGQLWLAGLLLRQKELNAYHVDFVVPEIGMPYVQETIGIIKNNKNEERAKQWVDWFGSTEVQTEWSARFGHVPANQETHSTFSTELKEAMSRCHPQKIDWGLATENLDSWMEKIQLEFVK